MPDTDNNDDWMLRAASGSGNQEGAQSYLGANGQHSYWPPNPFSTDHPPQPKSHHDYQFSGPTSARVSDNYPFSAGAAPGWLNGNNLTQQSADFYQPFTKQQKFTRQNTSRPQLLEGSREPQSEWPALDPRLFLPLDQGNTHDGSSDNGLYSTHPQQQNSASISASITNARHAARYANDNVAPASYQDRQTGFPDFFGQVGFSGNNSPQDDFGTAPQAIQVSQPRQGQSEVQFDDQMQDDMEMAPRGQKRPFVAEADTTSLTLTALKIKRPKLDLRDTVAVKDSAAATQAFQSSVVVFPTIRSMPAYVNEATSIQEAKNRRDRIGGTITYHSFGILNDDHATFTHQQLMAPLFQRFFDAILTAPGTPPDYITSEDREDFKKKQLLKHKACCDRMATDELQLDAMASIELLVAAAKRLHIHGISTTSLKTSEYNKQGAKQKIITTSDLQVDLKSTFLERLDRIVELCRISSPMALDVLTGTNVADMVAAPDAYAKRKFTNHNSNQGRTSRKKDAAEAKKESEEAKAALAEVQGGGGRSASRKGKGRAANFPAPDTMGGAGM